MDDEAVMKAWHMCKTLQRYDRAAAVSSFAVFEAFTLCDQRPFQDDTSLLSGPNTER